MHPLVAFLLQLALILGVARIFGGIMRRLNQPTVLGELAAGIVLGPSLLGLLFPDLFAAIFQAHALDPRVAEFYREILKQAPPDYSPLETISTIGLILLMLLTGLETDIRVMRNMGRAAFMASSFGMFIPFVSGLLLGMTLDASYVTAAGRLPLVLFLATAMAISAMPVIAKILIDLNMLKRNFGLVILSAAVVDDTIGWIALAVIAGLVTTGGVDAWHVVMTFGWLIVFLTFAAFVLFPLLNYSFRRFSHELRGGGELVLILCATLLCAAMTEAMHVHAVFGAFIAGVVLRQCSGLSAESLHQLESVTLALFAPLFLAAVGLRVDLTQLSSLMLPVTVIIVAVIGKVAGCFFGGVMGKLPRWEALALGLGMSARGAMGLVVAKVGLELGILNQDLFSSLVLMALVTSILAPASLRAVAHKLPLSDEEKLRERGEPAGFVPSANLKILVPAAGGQNAVMGCHIAAHLCKSDGDRVTALYIESSGVSWIRRMASRAYRLDQAQIEAYFNRLKNAAGQYAARLALRKQPAKGSILETILGEARAGYQFLVIGASGHKHPLYDPFVSNVVKQCPCHLVVVGNQRGTEWQAQPFKNILVPTNGSYFSDAAFEFAARYADATEACITVVYIAESRTRNPLLPAVAIEEVADHAQSMMRVTLKQQLGEKMKNPERLECHVRESESVVSGLTEEFQRETYDLVVLGAENKSLVERLYLGQHIEEALTELPCPIALVIPKVGGRNA